MKKLILILTVLTPFLLYSQVPDANSLMGLITVTSAERIAITGATDGMTLYDTDEKTIYTYSSVEGWQKNQIGPSVYVGSFIISTAGAQSITGLPFKPSQITFTAHANIEDIDIDNDNGIGNNVQGLQNSLGNMTGFARDDNGVTTQQVIFTAGHGNSINDISRFSSSSNCIGIRFSHQNGNDLGKILASLSSFDANGFTLNTTYVDGTLTVNSTNPLAVIDPTEVQGESLLVLYTAYR